MRLFVAIDIPAVIRENIRELIGTLKPAATNIRWSRPEGLHLTIKFLGEAQPAQLDAIKSSLANVHLAAPFSIAVRGYGCFPNERSPRVLWLGVEAGPELPEIAARAESSLEPLGFAKETRPFNAHLTLGRINGPGKILAMQEILRRREPLDFGTFEAREFFLFESKPGANGSVYTKIARFEIASANAPRG